MSRFFQELAYCETPMGPLSLRRKEILELGGREVFEVTLGDEFLTSSLFHDVEVALARLGLAEGHGDKLDVVVGGLAWDELQTRPADTGEKIRMDQLCSWIAAQLFSEWDEPALVPPDHLLQRIDHYQRVDPFLFERSDCGIPETEPADDNGSAGSP